MAKKNEYTQLKKQVQELLSEIVILTKNVPKPQSVEGYNGRDQYLTSERYEDIVSDSEADYIYDNELSPDEVVAKKAKYEAPTDGNGKPLKIPDDEAVYLYCINQYAKRVVKKFSDAVHNEDQYYNSNC